MHTGEFGSERLTQQIVDRILQLTAKKEVVDVPKMVQDPSEGQGHSSDDAWSPEVASKIILTGRQVVVSFSLSLSLSLSLCVCVCVCVCLSVSLCVCVE